MGKLGWTERDYLTSSPEAVYYAFQGYFSKMVDQSLAVRNAATIIYRALGGTVNMDKIWPLTNSTPDTVEAPTVEWWQKMKAKNAAIDKKIKAKNGR